MKQTNKKTIKKHKNMNTCVVLVVWQIGKKDLMKRFFSFFVQKPDECIFSYCC